MLGLTPRNGCTMVCSSCSVKAHFCTPWQLTDPEFLQFVQAFGAFSFDSTVICCVAGRQFAGAHTVHMRNPGRSCIDFCLGVAFGVGQKHVNTRLQLAWQGHMIQSRHLVSFVLLELMQGLGMCWATREVLE